MKQIGYKKLSLIIFAVVLLALVQTGVVSAGNYTVKRGDSLWNIAVFHGTSVESIKNASGVKGDLIMPGQKLHVAGRRAGLTAKEKDLLLRVVEAEAGGETYKGKVGVAAVLLNRVQDPRFPNTISGVVFERHAFESVSNGLIWRVNPSRDSYRAVADALNGSDPTYQAVFFWNPYKVSDNSWVWTRNVVVQYGDHVFAR